MLSHKIEISKEINKKGMGNEENFGILKQRPQNSFISSYIFGKNVSVIRKKSVGSDIHNGNL